MPENCDPELCFDEFDPAQLQARMDEEDAAEARIEFVIRSRVDAVRKRMSSQTYRPLVPIPEGRKSGAPAWFEIDDASSVTIHDGRTGAKLASAFIDAACENPRGCELHSHAGWLDASAKLAVVQEVLHVPRKRSLASSYVVLRWR